MLFVGRSEEQDRFRHVLNEVASAADGGPDEGHVVLVQGYGGIGKSTLLSRFGEIATGQDSRFTVAGVDWELDRALHPEHYALFAGPPIWRILEQVRGACEQAAAKEGRRVRRRLESGFAAFLRQVTHIRELEQRAAELGIGHVLGRQRLTAEQIGKVAKAGTEISALAGVPSAVTTTVSRAVDASVGMVSALRGDKERIDLAAYRALVDEIDGVVAAFSDGMRALARVRPVVVVLDTCELLGESGDWLREVTRRCGRRVLWVLGMRLEPDLQAAGDSDAVRYRRTLDERRLRVITLARFDDRTVADYLAQRLGSLLPEDLDVGRIVALTHAVPLAVQLLCDMLVDQLRAGRRVDDLYEEIGPDGQISTVVADMARRYLVHASRENSELHGDLPFLYGLALLRSEQDGPGAGPRFLFDWLNDLPREPEPVPTARDPELLATLWDTPVENVAAVMAGLAHRHDFVHSRNGSLHRDVRDAIRLYLLIPVHRFMVTAMNRRAADHFMARIAATNHTTIDSQLDDPTWRADVAGLLWHTCWINPSDGIALLRHLYPAAAVLQPAYASLLLDITTLFAAHCPEPDQQLLEGLTVLSTFWGKDGPAAGAAMDALAKAPSPARPLLAGPTEPYLHLLRASSHPALGLGLPEQVAQLRRAAASIRPGSGPTATRLGEIALELFLPDPTSHPQLGKSLVAGYKLATRYLPANPRAHANLGYALSDLGRFGEAEAAHREALRLSPEDVDAHVNLGYSVGEQGRFEEAEALYREAIRIDPGSSGAYVNLGYVLDKLGRFGEAEAACREAIRIDPDERLAYQNLGYILAELGRHEEAEAVDREAIRISPDDAGNYVNLGYTLGKLGRLEEAEAAYRKALRLNPEHLDACISLGSTLRELGRFEEAVAVHRQAVRFHPDDADARAGLGSVLAELGRFEEAEAVCREAVRLHPNHAVAHAGLGYVLGELGRFEEAEAVCREAVRLDPDDPEVHVNLGYMLAELGRFEETEAVYREAVRVKPDDVVAQVNLGNTLRELGRFEQAEATEREAIRIDPHHVDAHVNLGLTLGRLSRFREAEAVCREAVRIDPQYAAAHISLGYVLSVLGRFEEAEAACREAIHIDPDQGLAYANLGIILRELGRFEEAEAACREAIRIDPTEAEAYEHLGALRLFAGDRDQARPLLLEASRLSEGSLLMTEVLLWAMNRTGGEDDLEAHTPQAVLAAVEKPARRGSEQSPFSVAEARALALAGRGHVKEAVETLRSAVATRRADDVFIRPLYDLFSVPEPMAGLDELIQVWEEIIADDPAAVSEWGAQAAAT